MSKKQVIIMRGPSGSGKSSWIYQNCKEPVMSVVSADDFFLHEIEGSMMGTCPETKGDYPKLYMGGTWWEYKFNLSRLSEAHAACLGKFIKALTKGVPLIVVDNTHTTLWELANYRLAAELANYDVRIVSLKAETVEDIKTCAARNSKGTSIEIVAKMAYNYEPVEGEEIVPIEKGEE